MASFEFEYRHRPWQHRPPLFDASCHAKLQKPDESDGDVNERGHGRQDSFSYCMIELAFKLGSDMVDLGRRIGSDKRQIRLGCRLQKPERMIGFFSDLPWWRPRN